MVSLWWEPRKKVFIERKGKEYLETFANKRKFGEQMTRVESEIHVDVVGRRTCQ